MEENKLNPNAEEDKKTTSDGHSATPRTYDEPHLRSFGFTQSESSTTNIPPRLPMGYTYSAPKAEEETTEEEEPQEPTQEIIEQHPDLPKDDAPLRTNEEGTHEGVRVRKPRRKRGNASKALKRFGPWLLLIIVIAAIGATYPYWRDAIDAWHTNEPTPAVAADTLPPVKPEPIDTTPTGLSHEDSLRIQDSVRHARWLYWQRQKRAKQAQEQTAEEGEASAATPPTEHSSTAHSDTLR